MLRILYFASLREQVGSGAEDLAWSALTDGSENGGPGDDNPVTVASLIDLLRARDAPWPTALGPGQRIMVAVNQALARPETVLADGDEVAFFPPVTGG